MKLKRTLQNSLVFLHDRVFAAPLTSRRPDVPPEQAAAVVVSFYMPNISRSVPAAQRLALERLVPSNVAIAQVLTVERHGAAIDRFLAETRYRAVIVLDIDCVPVHPDAIARMLQSLEQGRIVGAAQRADHIDNGGHIYAAPFCVGFSLETYRRLGSPSFQETTRGDVGEELTYSAEQRGIIVDFLWPTSCEKPKWILKEGVMFGSYTVYAGLFEHAFQIRSFRHQRQFVARMIKMAASLGP